MDAQIDTPQFEIHLDVTIRQLKQDDLPKLEWYGQFQHYRRLFMRSYKGQLAGNRIMLVADINGFPVGRLFIQLNSPRSKLSDGFTKAYLYSFQVMEMFRGQHIGTQLIKTAEAILQSKQYKIATIAVTKDNAGGLRLYQRHGYVIYDEEAGHWQYTDHRGVLQSVHEPCWLLHKML